jgi:hypothetical protein
MVDSGTAAAELLVKSLLSGISAAKAIWRQCKAA